MNQNCVILEFASPITLAQRDRIKQIIEDNSANHFPSARLPNLNQIVVADRVGNTAMPTIAWDED